MIYKENIPINAYQYILGVRFAENKKIYDYDCEYPEFWGKQITSLEINDTANIRFLIVGVKLFSNDRPEKYMITAESENLISIVPFIS